jgi:hypothetical protein
MTSIEQLFLYFVLYANCPVQGAQNALCMYLIVIKVSLLIHIFMHFVDHKNKKLAIKTGFFLLGTPPPHHMRPELRARDPPVWRKWRCHANYSGYAQLISSIVFAAN